jgi:S-adenosylmethionine:tRNA ribosyltransferase-isomerase
MSDLMGDQLQRGDVAAERSDHGSHAGPQVRGDHGSRRPAGLSMDAYEYGLPDAAIAQRPVEPRSAARLLVGSGLAGGGLTAHATVADLPVMLGPGDVLVVNDTRVLAARLPLTKATGGRAEVLLLEPVDLLGAVWEALVRPARRLPSPTLLFESAGGTPVVEVGEAVGGAESGRRLVRLLDPTVVDRAGIMPLPPYIEGTLSDPDRYQTVYSAPGDPGDRSAAAPTAGLHFTPELLDACRDAGARLARVDLAIGLDTFRPITAPTAEEHVIHSERFTVPAETMAACVEADRVIAVGTTAVRALESAAGTGRLSGRTSLYIHGDHRFRVVDVLITNFHLPRSSLLLLVEAFCGPVWRELYATALAEGYRFLSFGDAMVVGRRGPKGQPLPLIPPGPAG